ncbi:unnamed protein product [Closterium sp. NIES-65]|nr:unnamed protein product [Closterium sp. NIES-65]
MPASIPQWRLLDLRLLLLLPFASPPFPIPSPTLSLSVFLAFPSRRDAAFPSRRPRFSLSSSALTKLIALLPKTVAYILPARLPRNLPSLPPFSSFYPSPAPIFYSHPSIFSSQGIPPFRPSAFPLDSSLQLPPFPPCPSIHLPTCPSLPFPTVLPSVSPLSISPFPQQCFPSSPSLSLPHFSTIPPSVSLLVPPSLSPISCPPFPRLFLFALHPCTSLRFGHCPSLPFPRVLPSISLCPPFPYTLVSPSVSLSPFHPFCSCPTLCCSVLHAQCPMPHAPCPIPHAPFPMPHTTCPMPHTPCPIPHAPYHMPHAPYPMPHTPCPIPHAPCPIPHAPCPIPHGPCPMAHAPRPVPSWADKKRMWAAAAAFREVVVRTPKTRTSLSDITQRHTALGHSGRGRPPAGETAVVNVVFVTLMSTTCTPFTQVRCPSKLHQFFSIVPLPFLHRASPPQSHQTLFSHLSILHCTVSAITL